MPRHARLSLPGVPLHIRQRGINRAPCFGSEADYDLYLGLMNELSPRFACCVHAYVLMTNHIHLLATPDAPNGASLFMKNLAQHAMGVRSVFLTPHSEYLRLGASASEREAAYLGMMRAGLSTSELAVIRGAINANAALGDEAFVAGIEARLGRTARPLRRGRPMIAISSGRKKSLSPV